MTTPTTLAIVLHWGRPDLTRAAVTALDACQPKPSILVVDNGSPPALRPSFKQTTVAPAVLTLPSNAGFAAAMNLALRWGRLRGFAFYWLVNDDVTVEPDAHARLVERASAFPRSAWTPRLVDAGGRDQHVGGRVTFDGRALRYLDAHEFPSGEPGSPWLSATAPFLSAASVDAAGPFDERFFAYWEDVDWSVRATANGVVLGAVPSAVAVHRQTATAAARTVGRYFLTSRNEFAFVRKHVPPGTPEHAAARVAARQLRLAGWLERRGEAAAARAVIAGGWSGLRGRTGPPRRVWVPPRVSQGLLSHALALSRRFDHLAGESVSSGPAPAQNVAS